MVLLCLTYGLDFTSCYPSMIGLLSRAVGKVAHIKYALFLCERLEIGVPVPGESNT